MTTVVLITCGKNKHEGRFKAKDLYAGSFFKSARRWAESLGVPWYILTYDKGLIDPEQMLWTYDYPPVKKIEPEWHEAILAELKSRGFKKVVFATRKVHLPPLPRPGVRYAFDVMPGTGIGYQKKFFTDNIGKLPKVKGVL